MYGVDDLVEAVLAETKDIDKNAIEQTEVEHSEWEKLANQLETAVQESIEQEEKETSDRSDIFRMKKLAMAMILDTLDDPKAKPLLEKIGQESLEGIKEAFQSPEPGSLGNLAQVTDSDTPSFVKEKSGKKTLFHRLKTNVESAPDSKLEKK